MTPKTPWVWFAMIGRGGGFASCPRRTCPESVPNLSRPHRDPVQVSMKSYGGIFYIEDITAITLRQILTDHFLYVETLHCGAVRWNFLHNLHKHTLKSSKQAVRPTNEHMPFHTHTQAFSTNKFEVPKGAFKWDIFRARPFCIAAVVYEIYAYSN